MKIIKYALGSILILFFLFVSLGGYFFSTPLLSSTKTSNLVIHFKPGMPADKLLDLLSEKGEVSCAFCLNIYLRLLPGAAYLQAGIYPFSANIRPVTFINRLLKGDILKQEITVIEGQLSHDIIFNLHKQPYLELEPLLKKQLVEYCVFCRKNIEGMFLANTYFYLAGTSDLKVLIRSHLALKSALDLAWKTRKPNLPYHNKYELLIAASIIEKETSIIEEKRLVSSVIVNRLNKKMRLQMDPTVIYGLSDRYQYPLKRKDLRIQTPYNTYMNEGLPPTPICNVGESALLAAANPLKSNYLYFVANRKGRHEFSTNLIDQIKAIKANREK